MAGLYGHRELPSTRPVPGKVQELVVTMRIYFVHFLSFLLSSSRALTMTYIYTLLYIDS
jgi:hypothetical protein